jgi:hypothetical protein
MPRLVLSSMLAVFAATVAAADPVALVTEMSGAATVATNRSPTALGVLQDLSAGARLTLASGSHVVVVHTASGAVYDLAGPGTFRVQASAIEPADANAQLKRRELPPEIRAYRLDAAVAAQASLVMRGASQPTLDGPDGGVLSENELRYRIGGALREGQLDVFDQMGARVLGIDRPEGVVLLKGRHAWQPGTTYRVEVSGFDSVGMPVALDARFVVMPPDAAARLRSRQPTDLTARTDWIVYALALEDFGARATARTIWRALQATP